MALFSTTDQRFNNQCKQAWNLVRKLFSFVSWDFWLRWFLPQYIPMLLHLQVGDASLFSWAQTIRDNDHKQDRERVVVIKTWSSLAVFLSLLTATELIDVGQHHSGPAQCTFKSLSVSRCRPNLKYWWRNIFQHYDKQKQKWILPVPISSKSRWWRK